MKDNLAIRQINRKRKRYIRQKQRRLKLASLGLAAVFAFIFVIRPHIGQNNTAKADSAELLSRNAIKKDDLGLGDQEVKEAPAMLQDNLLAEEGENKVEKPSDQDGQYTQEDQGFSDILKAYKIAKEDSLIYKDKSMESKPFATAKQGEYLKFYGFESNWAKVSYKNSIGYIKSDLLLKIQDNVMTVRDGILFVDKNHIVASDFVGGFDVEAENSLLIAIEAMKREGLEVGVGRRYTSFEDEKNYISNSKGEHKLPDEYTSELRTGFAVELHSLKTDPRIEDDFFDKDAGKWVKNNMHRFGFILRYPQGKEDITGFEANQHIFRYVGVEAAQYMYENDLTMEEYFK